MKEDFFDELFLSELENSNVQQFLHQRYVEVTAYYAAPTAQQLSNSVSDLHEKWVS